VSRGVNSVNSTIQVQYIGGRGLSIFWFYFHSWDGVWVLDLTQVLIWHFGFNLAVLVLKVVNLRFWHGQCMNFSWILFGFFWFGCMDSVLTLFEVCLSFLFGLYCIDLRCKKHTHSTTLTVLWLFAHPFLMSSQIFCACHDTYFMHLYSKMDFLHVPYFLWFYAYLIHCFLL
jgi:hypothetical protein